MIEQRIYCDKCGVECSDEYYMLNPFRKSITDGTTTTKTAIDLCPTCYGFIDQFLDLDFCIPVEDYETDYE